MATKAEIIDRIEALQVELDGLQNELLEFDAKPFKAIVSIQKIDTGAMRPVSEHISVRTAGRLPSEAEIREVVDLDDPTVSLVNAVPVRED